ncbi:MAG: DUF362 domain-containing protein [Bacillota bacterium]
MEKVSLVRCEDYVYEDVKHAIAESFKNLGGIESYIQRGDKVLLKMNLLMKKRPEEATTTHPEFVKALAEILIGHGAEVYIGDSPGGPFNEKALRGVYRVCGIENVANETGAVLNYNTNMMEVKNEKGKILRTLTVAEMLKGVDKVISVSKLKTHGMATFTGAVKNMFGIIPGILKAEYHFKMPNIQDFANALVDICLFAQPVLSFMDGIVGMEGDGPSAGTPRKVGVVVASASPYHLDVVASSIINLEPTKVPTIQCCVERGICRGSLEDIEIVGDKLEGFIVKDFIIPKTRSVHFAGGRVPGFVRYFSDRLLQPKPVFSHEICIGCGDCAENCPPKVIDMVDHKPEVNLQNCIRCFCCQELCPKKAVKIHRPWLLDRIVKW